MEALILLKESNDRKNIPIESTHFNDIPEIVLEKGVWINNYHEPQHLIAKMAIPYYNEETKEMFYKYEDRENTEDETVKQLKQEVAYLWYEVMMLGGM